MLQKESPGNAMGGRIDDPYWRYLVQTPWAEDRNQLVRYVRAAPDIVQCFSVLPVHYHYQDGLGYPAIAVKMMKLLLRLPAEIVKGFFLFVVACLRRFGVLCFPSSFFVTEYPFLKIEKIGTLYIIES